MEPSLPRDSPRNYYKDAPREVGNIFRGAPGSILTGLNQITSCLFPFRRWASSVPALAPEVSAALLPVEAERPRRAAERFAVFQIDAGDKYPRLLAPVAQTLQRGSAAREDYSSGSPAAATAVAVRAAGLEVAAVPVGMVAVAFHAAGFAAEVAVAAVFAAAVVVRAVALAAAVALVVLAVVVFHAAGFAVEQAVAAGFVVAVVVRAAALAAAVAPVELVAVAFHVAGFAVAVLARLPAGNSSLAAEYC